MPKLSASFRRFEERLDEVNHLRLIATRYARLRDVLNDKDKSAHTNALVRSGTVLLSSHIQGYIEDISDLVIDSMIACRLPADRIPDSLRYHATKSSISSIRQANDPTVVIERIRDFTSSHSQILSITGIISNDFAGSQYKDGFGNPTVKEIKRYFARFGVEEYSREMATKLKQEWPIVENAVNQIVDRRNKIAHGDSQATLTVQELSTYTKLARKFAATTDRVIMSHFRAKGCSL